MWSTEAMLAFVIFVFFSQLNVLQLAVGASVAPVAPNPPTASPSVPQTPVAGAPNQQPDTQPPGSLLEATSRLANVFRDVVRRFIQDKKKMIVSTLNTTSQLGTGGTRPDQAQPGAMNPPSTTPTQTPSLPPTQPAQTQPAQTAPAPAIQPAQPAVQQ